jgi:GTP-binding protein
MSASIAIVGRPNVGKSTLFNRFTHTRSALVGNVPGLTRDRQYGIMQINDQNVIIIDTGGIGEANTPIEILMEKQAKQALEEADIILFLVDARSGCTSADETLAHKLRKLNKPIFTVANKVEDQDIEIVLADFYKLGLGEPLAISAEHNLGIGDLIATIATKLPQKEEINAPTIPQGAIKIAFVGRPNVGKSTLVNRILGEERVIVYDQPGTTRDSIFINFNRRGKDYVLIDTAGIRRRGRVKESIEKFSVIKALQSIEATNVVVFVIDATENITDQDLKLLGFVLDAGKALVLAVNKWDNLPPQQRDKIKSELDRRLTFIDFAKILFISALHGTGVGDLFGAINKAYTSATKELKTPQLTKILEKAIGNFQPPLARGHEIKLRYAHIGGHNPPTIIIHGARTEHIPESYRRYLEHFYREALDLSGTPIRIVFKN